jgi:hypothetical protein
VKLIQEPAGVFPETNEQRAQRVAAEAGWAEDAGVIYDAQGLVVAQSMTELTEGLWRCGVILENNLKRNKLPQAKDGEGRQRIDEIGNPMTDWPELAQRVRTKLANPVVP